MTNHRFAEYATSGAFLLKMSRQQIAGLGIIIGKGERTFGGAEHPLERKGLVEVVPAPDCLSADRQAAVELRATAAGVAAYRLAIEAGLANGERDPMAVEMDAMRAELVAARETVFQVRRAATSTMARLDQAEKRIRELEAELAAEKSRVRLRAAYRAPGFTLTLKDPLPDATRADLERVLAEP